MSAVGCMKIASAGSQDRLPVLLQVLAKSLWMKTKQVRIRIYNNQYISVKRLWSNLMVTVAKLMPEILQNSMEKIFSWRYIDTCTNRPLISWTAKDGRLIIVHQSKPEDWGKQQNWCAYASQNDPLKTSLYRAKCARAFRKPRKTMRRVYNF